jgi:HTH-type transcriptional regulator/antitoxin HigA
MHDLMNNKNNSDNYISTLINNTWNQTPLRRNFEDRLLELGISFNQAEENLEIGYRTINGILDGTLERIDFLSLLKIGQFLDISYNQITDLYVNAIATKHKEDLDKSHRRTFILNNFDLPVLKNIGVIDSIRDFEYIERQLNDVLGLNSITEYNLDDIEVAYSSGTITPKNLNSRKYFIKKARAIFKAINNDNSYQKEALIEYFPKIKRQCIDVENGLLNVIKSLYNLGVTVIFQPRTPSIQLRGATFAVNNKPCIVLTDYKGYYPTLWFALIHEIFHVIFDWEEILKKAYHLSDESDDILIVKQKEDEANEFARDFMFPRAKLENIKDQISNRLDVREMAMNNNVHPSFIYANYAYEMSSEQKNLWQNFNKLKLFPPFNNLIKKLTNGLGHTSKAFEYAGYYKLNIFNKP